MMRIISLVLAFLIGLQPALADGPEGKIPGRVNGAAIDTNARVLAATGGAGGAYGDEGYDNRGRRLPGGNGPISRIKDIARLQSARDNQLVGYGLVIGLQGSGDSLRNSPFTEQSIQQQRPGKRGEFCDLLGRQSANGQIAGQVRER